jgi:hypothetical protein
MKLIDKDAVVMEIERRKKELIKLNNDFANQWACASLDNILSFLNTLEVEYVDLDREIRRYRMRNPIIQHREESLYDYMSNVAKHFFELGTKAQKEE